MIIIDIKQTKFTPKIIFDTDKCYIEIKGDSLPENTLEFYSQLMSSTKEYIANVDNKLTVNLELTYFNSSSSKFLFDFFDIFDALDDKSRVIINWNYDKDDESMEEAGQDFQEDFENLDFNLIAK